jgi:hypothetical protein
MDGLWSRSPYRDRPHSGHRGAALLMGRLTAGTKQPRGERGNSRRYALARLKRDFPELYQKVRAGKMSANRAAIQAGFREQKPPPTRIEKCLAVWQKMTAAEKRMFLDHIGQ